MKATNLIPALALLIPTLANAQPEPPLEALQSSGDFDHAVGAPRNALELGVAAGYSQGGGNLGGGMRKLEDIAGPGGAVELDVGYRLTPNLSLGAYGTFAKYATGDYVDDSNDVFGATAGIQAALHFRPARSVDPWVSLATGWKGLWIDPSAGKATSLQGLELARVQLGVDYRISKDVAIAPVIGGSVGMFVSQDSAMTNDYTEISDKEVNFTGFAGVAGRFDVGGTR